MSSEYLSTCNVAIPFHLLNEKLNNEPRVREFNITYDSKKNDYMKLVEFIISTDKRINIQLKRECNLSTIKELDKFSKDIYIRLTKEFVYLIPQLVEQKIKFFFDSSIPACNFTTLQSFIALGVTDVYIQDDLMYDLYAVRKVCRNAGVNLRLVLNRINESNNFYAVPQETSPFIRPNDIELMSKFFDTFEFDFPDKEWDILSLLYRVYFIDRDWHGDLQEIISQLKTPINNKTLIPDFTMYKINCKRNCARGKGCNKCEQFIALSRLLNKKQVGFKQ